MVEMYCPGTVSSTRRGVVRITEATFVPRIDIVAHRHEPLVDDAVERRAHDRVGERLARHRHPGARGDKRLVLLLGAVAGDVVLAPGRLGLGAAPVEVGLGQQLPLEEHPRAIEIRLREIGRGARVGDFGNPVDLERRAAAGESEPRLELGGIRAGLVRLRADLGFGDLHQRRARGHAACRAPPAWRRRVRRFPRRRPPAPARRASR